MNIFDYIRSEIAFKTKILLTLSPFYEKTICDYFCAQAESSPKSDLPLADGKSSCPTFSLLVSIPLFIIPANLNLEQGIIS